MTPDPNAQNSFVGSTDNQNSSFARPSERGTGFIRTFLPLVVIALFSLIGTYACHRAAGATLGLFFGGFVVATVLAPAAVLTQPGHFLRLIAILCVAVPIAAIWLIPVFVTPDTPAQWLGLSVALLAYSAAVGAVALLLRALKLPDSIAGAIAILLALAWLTWPIWLATTLAAAGADRLTSVLVSVHPPLTANGVLLNEPAWSERILAYQLTNLNQDIPMELPHSAMPCIVFHGVVAGVLYAIGFALKRRRVAVEWG